MIQYGTPDELAAWVDPDSTAPEPVPLATPLLRAASQTVLDCTATATYRTDADGKATDPATLKALTEATLEQASVLHLNGIDPRKGIGASSRRVASKSLSGASVSYVADARLDRFKTDLAGGGISQSAWLILRNAGLITAKVQTRDLGDIPRVDAYPYDPTTGRAIR